MARFRLPTIILIVLIIAGAAIFWQIRLEKPQFFASVTEALSTEVNLDQYERALRAREFRFPEDLGPHEGFQTEWWYYTGNLRDAGGRHFGYQLTVFRRAVSPEAVKRKSKWSTNQIYFAHFAVTDTASESFYSFERFSRGSAGLSGAQAHPFKVWIENWHIFEKEGKTIIEAEDSGISIQLSLSSEKQIVLQGDRGLSQKGAEPGNASYYYSQTRILSSGQIRIHSEAFTVSGYSWLDREWSTSALSKQQSGWDWFSIQLEDNREIMLFQIRQGEKQISPFSGGTLVLADGNTIRIKRSDFNIKVTDRWQSPHTNIEYPSGWTVSLPKLNITLQLEPYLADQEHRHSFAYWEGAVKIRGEGVTGSGYVELTGYKP
jgi:predicted secreted hydrolase